MSVELPMHLKQLEALPSALDIIRYLAKLADGAADTDQICADLGISERRFSKAMRRLVTNQYMQMRSDYSYELTRKGLSSAAELAEYDANAPVNTGPGVGKVARDLVIALPRQLTVGQVTEVVFGFEPFHGDEFNTGADVIVRFDSIHATVSTRDEMIKLARHAHRQTMTVIPDNYDQMRLKIQVFQLSPDGEDLTDCGGLYVDVDVVAKDAIANRVAYNTNLIFTI